MPDPAAPGLLALRPLAARERRAIYRSPNTTTAARALSAEINAQLLQSVFNQNNLLDPRFADRLRVSLRARVGENVTKVAGRREGHARHRRAPRLRGRMRREKDLHE